MKKKILIIGGTGFIGFHLAKKSVKLGWDVTSLSTKPAKKLRFLDKVNYIICDITKKKLLKKKIDLYFDYIVNLGGYVDHSNKTKTYNSHYIGLKNVVDIFLNKLPKSFIQIGTGGEYGKAKSPHNEKINCKPISNYAMSKFLSSKHLINLYLKKNFPCTILRLYQTYGPYQETNRFIPFVVYNCLKNKTFPCSEGEQYRDFIYIDDVISLIIKSIKSKKAKGQIFNVGLGKPKKIKNIIKNIVFYIKKGTPSFGQIKLRPDELKLTYPDISKAKKMLKWKPKVPLKVGLNKTIKYFQTQTKKIEIK